MQKSGSGRRIGAFFLDSLIFTFGSSIILSIFEDPTYTQQLLEIENAFMNGSIDFINLTIHFRKISKKKYEQQYSSYKY